MELYLIYGLPGVGKLAVARELMELRPGYRLFHIHQLADMLEPVFGFDGRGFIRLRDRVWPMVIEQAVADGLPGLITTFVFERSSAQRHDSERPRSRGREGAAPSASFSSCVRKQRTNAAWQVRSGLVIGR